MNESKRSGERKEKTSYAKIKEEKRWSRGKEEERERKGTGGSKEGSSDRKRKVVGQREWRKE